MTFTRFHAARRRLLQAAPLAVLSPRLLAQAPKRLDESDPAARKLGYTHDAARVDKAKFPEYRPGQACANCTYFRAPASAAWGPCDTFGGEQVAAKGWCAAWVKKP